MNDRGACLKTDIGGHLKTEMNDRRACLKTNIGGHLKTEMNDMGGLVSKLTILNIGGHLENEMLFCKLFTRICYIRWTHEYMFDYVENELLYCEQYIKMKHLENEMCRKRRCCANHGIIQTGLLSYIMRKKKSVEKDVVVKVKCCCGCWFVNSTIVNSTN